MIFRPKKIKVVTEVAIRPAPTPRDPLKRPAPTVQHGAGTSVKRAVKTRRSQPIRAYIGPNGHGKSLAAVNDLLPSLDRGRLVLSTVPLLDWRLDPSQDPDFEVAPDLTLAALGARGCDKPRDGLVYVHRDSGAIWRRPEHPNYRRLTQFKQIMEFDRGDIFLDEVAGVASSRQHAGMPAAIERMLQKLRKGDITLTWTAPSWARADLIIRETTQAVTVCEGHRPEKEEFDDRLWKRNRLFEFSTYDAKAYTDFTEGKREKAKRLAFQRFHGPGSDAFNAYDTVGGVDTIESVTDAGRCVDCGGTRTAPKCSCPDYVHRVASADAARRAVGRSPLAEPQSAVGARLASSGSESMDAAAVALDHARHAAMGA